MMILIDFKTFDDDSCKFDFENPGIATSCCCSIPAADSKDQLKQTSTLCRGLNIFFWKIHTCWKNWYNKPALCAEVFNISLENSDTLKKFIQQTSTLCSGLNISFGKFWHDEKFDTTNLHSVQKFEHFRILKNQIQQTHTLCRGFQHFFGQFSHVEKFYTTNLHSVQRFKHFLENSRMLKKCDTRNTHSVQKFKHFGILKNQIQQTRTLCGVYSFTRYKLEFDD